MKLVQVKWVDSHSFDSWVGVKQLEGYPEVVDVISVGWLMDSNNKTITIASHVTFDRSGDICQCSGDMTIPKVAVVEIKELPHRFALRE